MHRMSTCAALILLLGIPGLIYCQPSTNAENLLFSAPKNYKIGFKSEHDNPSITEWIPVAETVQDWTEMLTVKIDRGAKVDSAVFLDRVGKRYMAGCPGTIAKGIFTGKTNGYDASMLVLKCPKNPATGKPETAAFRVIKGNDAMYSVQRAWTSVPSENEINDAMQDLAKVTVCDARASDHPCP